MTPTDVIRYVKKSGKFGRMGVAQPILCVGATDSELVVAGSASGHLYLFQVCLCEGGLCSVCMCVCVRIRVCVGVCVCVCAHVGPHVCA